MLTAGFDSLSKIHGLFDADMMVTTLHTVLATKYYEVSKSSGLCYSANQVHCVGNTVLLTVHRDRMEGLSEGSRPRLSENRYCYYQGRRAQGTGSVDLGC